MDAATGRLVTVFCHFPSPFHKPFPNDLSFPDIINIFYFIYHSSSSSFCTLLLYILEEKMSKGILKAIKKEIEDKKSDCIAFTCPISHIVGLNDTVIKKFEENIISEEIL